MKRITKLIGIVLISLLLSACSTSTKHNDSEQAVEPLIKPYVAIISKGWQHQFWQSVKMGAFKAAKELNIELTFEGPEGDFAVDKQLNMLATAIDKEPAAIIIAASDSKAVIPKLEEAQKLNIPIIAFDSGVDSDIPITSVATDNYNAAGLVADKIAQAIGNEGEVGILCHDNYSRTGIDRRDGFSKRMEEKYPNITVVEIQYSGGDHDLSKNMASEMVQNHPNIKAIFATNEGTAIGLIQAVVSGSLPNNIVIAGFDSGKTQKDAIRTGVMLGAVTQNPFMIGYYAVVAASKSIHGEEVANFIDTGYEWYDANNIDDENISKMLYD